jgi:hypothetical protein
MSFEPLDSRHGVIVRCPACSHPPAFECRPSWHYARHTSRREGRSFWVWSACCQHSAAVDPKRVISDEDRAQVENRWAEEAVKVFDAYTANWKPEHREDRRERFFENRALQAAKKEPNMVPDDTKPNETTNENENPE